MGVRFSKRVKVLPGVTLNFSKSGVSTSIGKRGARVTLGHGKTRTTLGAPGTGLSYTSVKRNTPAKTTGQPAGIVSFVVNIAIISILSIIAYFFFKFGLWQLLF